MIEAPMLRDPHLVLADIAAHDGVGGQFRQALEQRRGVHVRARCVVARGVPVLAPDAERAPGILRGGIAGHHARQRTQRSEEHTSELQSLMRKSYAVFCLKKNNRCIKSYYMTNITVITNQIKRHY